MQSIHLFITINLHQELNIISLIEDLLPVYSYLYSYIYIHDCVHLYLLKIIHKYTIYIYIY